jgi:hypothetical protein
MAVSVDGAGGVASGAGTEGAAAGAAAGVSLAAGATAAVVAGAFGDTEASGCASLGGSTDVGIVPVVAGFDDENVVVVPPAVSCVVDSAIAGTLPAQQTPNKLTPRRRSTFCLIIPRLAPIGERRGDASVADTT